MGSFDTLIAAYAVTDGSRVEVHYDEDGSYANPRECDGNVATLVQVNDRYLDVDDDTAGLEEAWYRWGGSRGYDGPELMARYIAIFHPEILHYDEWSAGQGSHGYGYVLRDDYERAMLTKAERAAGLTWQDVAGKPVSYDPARNLPTPAECFDQEVNLYGQWANGEVYGVVTFDPTTCRVCGVRLLPRGDRAISWEAAEDQPGQDADTCRDGKPHAPLDDDFSDSCWGFLGCGSPKAIARNAIGADDDLTEVFYC